MRWIESPEIPSLLRQIFGRSDFESGEARLALIRHEGQLVPVAGCFEFGTRGPDDPILHSYGSLLLCRARLSVDRLAGTLPDLSTGFVLDIPSLGLVQFKGGWSSAYLLGTRERYAHVWTSNGLPPC